MPPRTPPTFTALSDIVGAAGVMDVEEGVDMLLKGGNVRAMSAIVGLMSKEELDRGLELARLRRRTVDHQ